VLIGALQFNFARDSVARLGRHNVSPARAGAQPSTTPAFVRDAVLDGERQRGPVGIRLAAGHDLLYITFFLDKLVIKPRICATGAQ